MSVRSWFSQIISGTPTITENTQYTHSGGSSLSVSGSSGDTIYLYQEIFLVDEVYTFSAYVMSVLAQTGAQVGIQIRAYDEDVDGNPTPTGSIYFSANLSSTIPVGSWGRGEVTVDLSSIPVIDHCILVLILRSGTNPIYVDDIMLNRGNTAFPYQQHIADYFYSEDILTEVPPQEYLGTYTMSLNQLYKNLDTNRYYLRLGIQIDPSITPVVVTDTINEDFGQGAIPGQAWPVDIVNNTLLDGTWRKYGDNRVIQFPAGFDPYVLISDDFPLHIWFQSSSSVVLNGSLLAEGSVNADSINVFNLSAISANVGELYSGVLRSLDWESQGSIGSKIDLTAGTLQLGGGGTGTPKLLFDGTNLVFGDGAIMWNNLDAQSQANLEGPQGPPGADGADGAQGPPGPAGQSLGMNIDWSNGSFLLLNVGGVETTLADYSPATTTFTVTLQGQTGTLSTGGFNDNITNVPLQDGVPYSWQVQAVSSGVGSLPYITAANGIGTFAVNGNVTGMSYYTVTRLSRIKGTYISSTGIYTGDLTADRILSGVLTLSRSSALFPHIKGGKTGYDDNTTAGFFLGMYTDQSYRFHIGSSTNWLKWTGSELNFRGYFSLIFNNNNTSGRLITIGKSLFPNQFQTPPGSIADSHFEFDYATNWYTYSNTLGWTKILRIADDNANADLGGNTNFIIATDAYNTTPNGKASDHGFATIQLNHVSHGMVFQTQGASYGILNFLYGPRRSTQSYSSDRFLANAHNNLANFLTLSTPVQVGTPQDCVISVIDSNTNKVVWAHVTSWTGSQLNLNPPLQAYLDAGLLNGVGTNSKVQFHSWAHYPQTSAFTSYNKPPPGIEHLTSTSPLDNPGVAGISEHSEAAGIVGLGYGGYGGYFDGDKGAIILAANATAPPATAPNGTIYHQANVGIYCYSTINNVTDWRPMVL